jgi:hypothetical protein
MVGVVVLIICWCCWWWWWKYYCECPTSACDCPETNHVEAYVVTTATGCRIEDGAGTGLMEIYVNPGDIMIWSNETADTVDVDFTASTTGTPFSRGVIEILPGTQQVTRVRDDAGGVDYDPDLDCGGSGGPSGGPTVKVGEGDG